MPLTSPGNDDDTGENHQPTLRKNTAEPVEQTLKQNKKTAARWARARTLDGRTVKFSAVAFPIRDSDKNLWGVAISYDPADQPATEPHEPTADHPTFDTGH